MYIIYLLLQRLTKASLNDLGENPSWYLSRVYVEDLENHKRYLFTCEQWLAVEFDDGEVDRLLPCTQEDDKKPFSHVFTTKTAEDFSDQHIWLSVFLKRPYDTFSRVERITCCFVLLLTTMLTSAMFFNLGGSKPYILQIGSLAIDYKGIIVGIQAALIVIPINTGVIHVFRNSESKSELNARKELKKVQGKSIKRTKTLPHCALYFGWILAFLASAGSIIVILFYSMMWGDKTSKQWLASVFTGFFQSACVIQPIKLVAVAVLFAAIFRRTKDEDFVLDIYKASPHELPGENGNKEIDISNISLSPLTESDLQEARKQGALEIRMKLFFRDLMSYIIFLIFLSFIVGGYRDPMDYKFAKSVENIVIGENFKSINNVPSIWSWAQVHFITGIYENVWYNGKEPSNSKLLGTKEAFRIGSVRIRQVRIKGGTCDVAKDMTGQVHICSKPYSITSQDEINYEVGWKSKNQTKGIAKRSTDEEIDMLTGSSFKQTSNHKISKRALKLRLGGNNIKITSSDHSDYEIEIEPSYLLPNGRLKTNIKHWEYNDALKLRGFPYFGKFALYSGGGYVASFGQDVNSARAAAVSLEQDSWIDKYTRAVFFEFSVYNSNKNLFGAAFIAFEITPTGQVAPSGHMKVFRLYRYIGAGGKLLMASEIILLLIFIYFIYKELRHWYRMGKLYLKQFWSWIEIIITLSLFSAFILWFIRWYEGDKNLMRLHENPNSFISFQYAAAADETLMTAITVISFFSIIKILKIIGIFPMIVILKGILRQSQKPLWNYFLPFTIAFIAFSLMGYLLFFSNELFSSFISSLETQLIMLLGGPVFGILRSTDWLFGPLYFFLFTVFEVIVLMNIFFAILNESIADSSSEMDLQEEDLEFINFTIKRFLDALYYFHPQPPSNGDINCITNPEDHGGFVANAHMRKLREKKKRMTSVTDIKKLFQRQRQTDEIFDKLDWGVTRIEDTIQNIKQEDKACRKIAKHIKSMLDQ